MGFEDKGTECYWLRKQGVDLAEVHYGCWLRVPTSAARWSCRLVTTFKVSTSWRLCARSCRWTNLISRFITPFFCWVFKFSLPHCSQLDKLWKDSTEMGKIIERNYEKWGHLWQPRIIMFLTSCFSCHRNKKFLNNFFPWFSSLFLNPSCLSIICQLSLINCTILKMRC